MDHVTGVGSLILRGADQLTKSLDRNDPCTPVFEVAIGLTAGFTAATVDPVGSAITLACEVIRDSR